MWLKVLTLIPPSIKSELTSIINLLSLITIGVIIIFKLWQHNLSVPFIYTGDSLFSLMLIKNWVVNHSWIINPNLGFPNFQNLADFPLFEFWNLIILSFLSLLTTNIYTIQNLFFLLTFFIVGLSSFYVLRRFKVKNYLAVIGSLLFTFLPFHLISNTNHLFLSNYSSIPLIILLTVNLMMNKQLNLLAVICLTLYISGTGIYYAFFALFFLSIGTLFNWLKHQNRSSVLIMMIGILLILGGLLVQALPNLIYSSQQGKNILLSSRLPLEAEVYSLRFNQLFFPLSFSPSQISGKLKGEGSEYLGLAGIAGLLLLLGWPMINHKFTQPTNFMIANFNYSVSHLYRFWYNFSLSGHFSNSSLCSHFSLYRFYEFDNFIVNYPKFISKIFNKVTEKYFFQL